MVSWLTNKNRWLGCPFTVYYGEMDLPPPARRAPPHVHMWVTASLQALAALLPARARTWML